MTILLIFIGLNAVLLSSVIPFYDYVGFHPYWEQEEGSTYHSSRVSYSEIVDEYLGFGTEHASNLDQSTIFNPYTTVTAATTGTDLLSGSFNETANANFPATFPGSQTTQLQTESQSYLAPILGEYHENWGDLTMEDICFYAGTSTHVDGEDKSQQVEIGQFDGAVTNHPVGISKQNSLEQKKLRKLAQNREAARKSRLRKKAYIQQLENNQVKLNQLQQEHQRAPQQEILISSMGDQSHTMRGNGAMAFDAEYARWLEEQNTHINELRIAVNSHASDPDLRIIVEKVATHFKNLVRLKDTAAKDDVFLIFSGMWKPPAIRCFMWIGGFRPSKLLKLLVDSLRPLTKLQEADINNLEQSSHEAEEALSQQMEALQQSLAETLVNGTCVPEGSSGNMENYMGRMANAMGKLVGHEGFFREAEKLRQQTLERMHLILTPRQSARALLTMHEYFLRLKALGDLWMTRPRE